MRNISRVSISIYEYDVNTIEHRCSRTQFEAIQPSVCVMSETHGNSLLVETKLINAFHPQGINHTGGKMAADSYPIFQFVPLGCRIIESVVIQRNGHLAEEIVAAERVIVPDRHPECPCLQLALRDVILRRENTNDYQGCNIND